MAKWSVSLSTTSPLLDGQHEALFGCVEELTSAASEGRTLLTFHAVLQLRSYIEDHFSTEEAMMLSHGFPGRAEHVLEHRRFSARLSELMEENIRRDNSKEMIEFLERWLWDHIARRDQEYVPYLQRAEGKEAVPGPAQPVTGNGARRRDEGQDSRPDS
jgi:hemerythrin